MICCAVSPATSSAVPGKGIPQGGVFKKALFDPALLADDLAGGRVDQVAETVGIDRDDQ